MTAIIVGSVAMCHHGLTDRIPKDVDMFTPTHPETAFTYRGRPLRVETFWHPSLTAVWGGEVRTATVHELYTIKISHSYWTIRESWQKHMDDAMALKAAGAELIPALHSVLYGIWADRYGAKRVDLNQDKASFFGPGVPRIYDHDSVHRAVAYTPGTPRYTRLLRPGAEVAIDMAELRRLPDRAAEQLWREETAVLALERYLIPAVARSGVPPSAATQARAWRAALRKMITSCTRGYSATWLATNYDTMVMPDGYWDRFESGTEYLVPFEEETC